MKLGILGGTFDPVHYGHLRLAEEAKELLGLDRLRFIPAAINPLKRDRPATPAAHRIGLLRAALAGRADADVDDRETRREGPSFTIDTLRELRRELPQAELYMILGMDAFRLFPRWKAWCEVVTLAHLFVATRPGEPRVDPRSALSIESPDRLCYDEEQDTYRFKSGLSLTFREITPLAIAATALRERMAAGRSVRYLTPDSVIAYAQQHGLYKE